MTHITIPLLKDSLKQCSECKLYFPSQENLNDHISKKHVKVDRNCPWNGKKLSPKVSIITIEDGYKTANNSSKSKDHVNNDRNCHQNGKKLSSELPIENTVYDLKLKSDECHQFKDHVKADRKRHQNGRNMSSKLNFETQTNVKVDKKCQSDERNLSSNLSDVRNDWDNNIWDGLLREKLLEKKRKAKVLPEINNDTLDVYNDIKGVCNDNLDVPNYTLDVSNDTFDVSNDTFDDFNDTLDVCNDTKTVFNDSLNDFKDTMDVVENKLIKHQKMDIKSRIFFEDDEILSSLDKCYQDDIKCEEVVKTETVHYDELKRLGQFPCKYCNKMYYNRYDLIIHETRYLHLKPTSKLYLCPICERFTNKTRTRHIFEKHRENFTISNIQKPLRICKKCHWPYYDMKTHKSTSHHLTRPRNKPGPHDRPQTRIRKQGEMAVFQLCELCYVRNMCKVTVIKNISELNKLCCSKCSQVFFEGKLVRGALGRPGFVRKYVKNQSKHNTNELRLKNIQHRWKQMRKTIK